MKEIGRESKFYTKEEKDLRSSDKLSTFHITTAILWVHSQAEKRLTEATLLTGTLEHLLKAFQAKKLWEFCDEKVNMLSEMEPQHFETLLPLLEDLNGNLANKLDRMMKKPLYAHLQVLDILKVMNQKQSFFGSAHVPF